MTILDNGKRNQYTATSGQTVFVYDFEIFESGDIRVYRGDTLLALTTDYTLTGVGDNNGGNVTLTSGATAGDIYTIFRQVTPERTTDYQESGQFLAQELNDDFDRLWAVIQEQETAISRTLQLAEQTTASLPLLLEDGTAGNLLRWNDTATGIDNVAASTITPETVVGTDFNTRRTNYAAVRLIDTSTVVDGQVVTVTDDGIAGDFVLRNSAGHGLTDNGGTIIVIDSDWYADRIYSGLINIEWFGAVENTDSSASIRAAIATGPCFAPAKRYIYDGATITTSPVMFIGERMPFVNSGLTSLENGTIIEGSFVFSGENVHLVNFGVDLGASTSASSGDGIKCTTALNAGEHLHIENLIALGKNKTDAFHALLFESYQKVTGGNIHGINNLFSCVIKCKDVNLTSVYGTNSQSRGLYLKSDNVFGRSWYINIDNVIVDGNASTGQGLYVQSDGAQLDKVNLGNVLVRGYAAPAEVNLSGAGVGINEINIDNLTLVDATSNALQLVAGAGFVYNCKITNLSIIDCDARAINTTGTLNHIYLDNVFISYRAGTLDSVMEDAVYINTGVLRTTFSNITITRAYSSNSTDFGWINYLNSGVNNSLLNYNCRFKGSGVPSNNELLVSNSGGNFTVDPPPCRDGRTVTITTQMTANGTITDIGTEIFSGVEFRPGTLLNIINDSATFTLTINHNPASGVRNKGSSNKTIGPTESALYSYSTSGNWQELVTV